MRTSNRNLSEQMHLLLLLNAKYKGTAVKKRSAWILLRLVIQTSHLIRVMGHALTVWGTGLTPLGTVVGIG